MIAVTPGEDKASLRVETPDGAYTLTTDRLVVADGAQPDPHHAPGWISTARSSWTASSSPTWS